MARREEETKKLTEEAFNKIEVKKWRSHMKDKNQTFESCPICYIDYEHDTEMKVLTCQHAYHSSCLHNWVKKNASCPICKKDITPARP